jgi:DNA-binding MarR family transcriptional regulator
MSVDTKCDKRVSAKTERVLSVDECLKHPFGSNRSCSNHYCTKNMDEVFPSASEIENSIQNPSYELRILSSIRRIARAVDIYSRVISQRYGVTVPQLICLLKLDELGSLSIKELSTSVNLSASVVVGIIDRLEKQDFVIRERSVRDRRIVRVYLAEKAKQLIANSPSPLQENLKEAFAELPELERATIALSLEKVCSMMESESINPEATGREPGSSDIATL